MILKSCLIKSNKMSPRINTERFLLGRYVPFWKFIQLNKSPISKGCLYILLYLLTRLQGLLKRGIMAGFFNTKQV